jgi:hypothetical protein
MLVQNTHSNQHMKQLSMQEAMGLEQDGQHMMLKKSYS